MLEAARVTLGLAVMGAALRLPRGFVLRRWRDLALVLGVGMPLMWLATSVAAWVFLPLPPLACLVIGSVMTPTDPVISSSIVTGRIADRNIPPRIRGLITAESGANDGLALLFLTLR